MLPTGSSKEGEEGCALPQCLPRGLAATRVVQVVMPRRTKPLDPLPWALMGAQGWEAAPSRAAGRDSQRALPAPFPWWGKSRLHPPRFS